MRRLLRDVKELVAAAGGQSIKVEEGTKHTRVHFTNFEGETHWVTVHKGSNPKRYEDVLRSQLRRRGLQP